MPYKPNPLKYAYLLQNEYPEISNLEKKPAGGPKSRSGTPAQPIRPEDAEGGQSAENGGAAKERQASPSPEFGGREKPTAFKKGDAIGVLEKRPTNA